MKDLKKMKADGYMLPISSGQHFEVQMGQHLTREPG